MFQLIHRLGRWSAFGPDADATTAASDCETCHACLLPGWPNRTFCPWKTTDAT